MREEKIQVIQADDPAIETERMTWKQLLEYGVTREFSLIEPYLRPGSRATIYTLREIPGEMFESWVQAGATEYERFKRAFMAACVRVDNIQQADGTTTNWVSSRPTSMTEEECNARFSAEEREEIGRVAYQHSFLRRTRRLRCALPPMLAQYWAERTYLPADESPPTAAPSS